MRSSLKLIAVLAAVAIASVTTFATLRQDPPAPAVEFGLLSGDKLASADLRGKVYLVAFWATTCAPCVAGMPKLVAAHEALAGRGFETVALAMHHDRPERVAEFARARHLPFRVAYDEGGNVAKHFGNVRITPTLVLVDRQGRVVKRYVGEPDWRELDRLARKALTA